MLDEFPYLVEHDKSLNQIKHVKIYDMSKQLLTSKFKVDKY